MFDKCLQSNYFVDMVDITFPLWGNPFIDGKGGSKINDVNRVT